MKALLGDPSLLAGYAEKTVEFPGSQVLMEAVWRTSVPAAPLILGPVCSKLILLRREGGDLTSALKSESLLGDHSLLAGYAQKAVESLGSLVQNQE